MNKERRRREGGRAGKKKPRSGAYGGMRTGAGSPWGTGECPHEVFTMEDTDVSGLWFS